MKWGSSQDGNDLFRLALVDDFDYRANAFTLDLSLHLAGKLDQVVLKLESNKIFLDVDNP